MDGDMPPEEATANSLPDDVIFDILSRVPLNSVCRFRCTSKAWRDLTSSPAFLAEHKSRHAEPFLVDTVLRSRGRSDLRLMDMEGNIVRVIKGLGGRGVLPMTSLDDLVCVADGNGGGARVVDPGTGEVLVTSPSLEEVIKEDRVHYSVARSHEIFGIGRTASSGVYKVVRHVLRDSTYVLTIGDGRGWRRKKPWFTGPLSPSLDRYRSPVAINGVMYFAIDGSDGSSMECFDLQKERWRNANLIGPEMRGNTESAYITELNGALCMVQREYQARQQQLRDQQDPHNNSCTNVWILDDSDKQGNWTKAYTIPKGPQGCRYMPLRVMQDGGERLLVHCVTGNPPLSSALQVYDRITKTCADIAGAPKDLARRIGLCNLHLEHLVSVKN